MIINVLKHQNIGKSEIYIQMYVYTLCYGLIIRLADYWIQFQHAVNVNYTTVSKENTVTKLRGTTERREEQPFDGRVVSLSDG